MRLNPKKYAFSVKVGKFLKFMLTKQGIKANPIKCEAIINMKSLTSVREVQVLNDRLTALTQFISWLANNLLLFSICSKITNHLNGLMYMNKLSRS